MSEISTLLRRLWRSQLRPDSLLDRDEAVAALPLRPKQAQEWLDRAVAPAAEVDGEPVYLWRDIVKALLQREGSRSAPDGPLTTWRAIAAAIGVSEDTVARLRARRSDQSACYFSDAAAAQAWWAALRRPEPPASLERPPRRRRERQPRRDEALDVAAVVRELLQK